MRRMGLLVACVLCLTAGACGGSGHAKTTDPTLAKVTTTTSTTVSYEVPATIDLAYVNKVMKALDHVYGDAIRHLAQTKQLDPTFTKALASIYTPSESIAQQEIWSRQQQTDGFASVKVDGGDPMTVATRLAKASNACIVVAVDRTFQPAFSDNEAPLPNRYVALVPAAPAQRPVNPTGWAMTYDGFQKSGGEPETPC